MDRKNWSALSLGVIIGVVATSLYWHSRQERSKFMFDQNVKCQHIAKQYEAEKDTLVAGGGMIVHVLRTAYSPERHSCVAEVMNVYEGNTDYFVEDLISGEGQHVFRYHSQSSPDDFKKLFDDYDAQFANFAHKSKD